MCRNKSYERRSTIWAAIQWHGLTITVKNHMIIAENRKLTMMMAGADCINLKMSGPETIICTISPSLNYVCNKLTGPILVMYSSSESKFTIESSQIFEFNINNTLGVSTLSSDCSLRYPESEHLERIPSIFDPNLFVGSPRPCFWFYFAY